MPKYRVSCGSLVTKLMQRKFTVSANNEDEAVKKAEELFINACHNSKVYTDFGGSLEIDDIERIE